MADTIAKAAPMLAAWLADNRISQTAFAARVGVSQGSISSYLIGRHTPRISIAHRIAEATRGKVPAVAWFEVAGSGAQRTQAKTRQTRRMAVCPSCGVLLSISVA